MEKLKEEFKESLVIKMFSKVINYDYANNKMTKLLNLLFNRSSDALNKMIFKNSKLKEAISESALFKLFKLLTEKTYIINGIIIALCMNIPHSSWNNMYIVCGMFLITLIYYMRNVLWNKDKFDFRNLSIGFLLFVIATIIASFISLDFASSLRQFLFYVTGFLAYMNVACTIRTKKDLVGFCYILFAMTIAMSMYGLYQNHVGVAVKEAYVDTELNEGMGGRVYGSVENPNNFAEVLLMMIPICGAIFLGEKKWRNKIIVAILSCMPILVMLLTGTRSGWGALGIAAFIFCLLWDKRIVPVFLIAVMLAFAALPYASPAIYKRVKTIFISNSDHSMSYRETIMSATVPVLRDNWISGIGMGSTNFSRHIANNYDFETSAPPHSHNVYVQMWVELGFLGFISFILMLISTWIYSLRSVFKINKEMKKEKQKYEKQKYVKYILIALIAGTAGLAVMGFLDYVLFYPRIMILFFVYLGLARAAQKVSKVEGEEANE